MKEKIYNFLKQPSIYLIIICILLQSLIYKNVQKSEIYTDSITYVDYALNVNFFKGEVDERRTPIYPYFIKIILKLGGKENLANNVAKAQKILFIVTLILFYECLKLLTKNKVIICLATIIFGTSPFIILWNVTVLTESIAIFETTLLAFLTIKYLKKTNYYFPAFIGLIILIMIMTRPSFIYILPIFLIFWILKIILCKEERKKAAIGIISCLICIILLLVYCALMKQHYGKFALTTISNINNVASVIKSGAYKNASNEKMIKIVEDELKQKNDIWYIFDKLASQFNNYELEEFAKTSMKSKIHKEYLIQKTIDLGKMYIGTNYAHDLIEKKVSSTALLEKTIPIKFNLLYVILVISIIYLMIDLIKSKKINWIVAFFTAMIIANLFTLIVGAPEEEQRLFAPSIVLVLLYIVKIMESIIDKLKV